jgi:hypothetical protein
MHQDPILFIHCIAGSNEVDHCHTALKAEERDNGRVDPELGGDEGALIALANKSL